MKIVETANPNDDIVMGAQIRALRKAKGLSLQQLSEARGLSIGLISQIERGLSSPSVKALRSPSVGPQYKAAIFRQRRSTFS
jgi:transcriptional regulator with XRE-family HTH domain